MLGEAAEDARRLAGEPHYTGCRVRHESEMLELWLFDAPAQLLEELEALRRGVYVVHAAPRPLYVVDDLRDSFDWAGWKPGESRSPASARPWTATCASASWTTSTRHGRSSRRHTAQTSCELSSAVTPLRAPPRRRTLFAPLAVAFALLLAACGGSGHRQTHLGAAALLSHLEVPPGARRVRAEPHGDGGLLRHAQSIPGASELSDLHRTWLVHKSYFKTTSFVEDRLPSDAEGQGRGAAGGPGIPPDNEDDSYIFPTGNPNSELWLDPDLRRAAARLDRHPSRRACRQLPLCPSLSSTEARARSSRPRC